MLLAIVAHNQVNAFGSPPRAEAGGANPTAELVLAGEKAGASMACGNAHERRASGRASGRARTRAVDAAAARFSFSRSYHIPMLMSDATCVSARLRRFRSFSNRLPGFQAIEFVRTMLPKGQAQGQQVAVPLW